MNIIVEIIIAGLLILYIVFETIRINVFRKDKNGLIAGLASMLSILFGIYLSIKNGLTLDYGTAEEAKNTHALTMACLGLVNILVGGFFILLSIIKFIVWGIKKAGSK